MGYGNVVEHGSPWQASIGERSVGELVQELFRDRGVFTDELKQATQRLIEKCCIRAVADSVAAVPPLYHVLPPRTGPKGRNPAIARQPAPTPSTTHPTIASLVQSDITARVAKGVETYGQPLYPHNGRDALVDAYQEAIDLMFYLRQAIYERDFPE